MRPLLNKFIFFILLSAGSGASAYELDNNLLAEFRPLKESDWSYQKAAHLLERAGFGGTPSQIHKLLEVSPEEAVDSLVNPTRSNSHLLKFEHSEIFDPGLEPFPASRPATTKLAKETGQALGIKVRANGNRPLQPIVNKFFYWLRASRLETDRVTQWWAERMVFTDTPLTEKMALFWHGHFATNEDKVRDYRKMLKQLQLFQNEGLGNFRALMVAVAKDPAMLAFLDAGVNIKESPNENFAREIVELFTMGVGHYTEQDVREAARAFTGWNYNGLNFVLNRNQHDNGSKTFLGHTGNLSGEKVIEIILNQKVSAEFIASKIYAFFVSENIDPLLRKALGQKLQDFNYEIRPFLKLLFLSENFYSTKVVGTRIKSPTELIVSTYRKLELNEFPGAPDFNHVTGSLGQRLMHPPTVAGWSYGRAWITPSLLIQRGNFAYNLMFPDIEFIPWDKYPGEIQYRIINVHQKIRDGASITEATKPVSDYSEVVALSNQADRNEEFNTRFGSYRGWQMAIERVLPIERDLPQISLTKMIISEKLNTKEQVVDYLVRRFISVPLDEHTRVMLGQLLLEEVGDENLSQHINSIEMPLRTLLHAILSLPEYQLG
jgi:hypothetical protein